jgi:hypothetical protein
VITNVGNMVLLVNEAFSGTLTLKIFGGELLARVKFYYAK